MQESLCNMIQAITNLARMLKPSGFLLPLLTTTAAISFMQNLVERDTSWAHIQALEAVILKYGLAATYYVDSHSIFRFVQGRDSFLKKTLQSNR